MSRWPDQLFGTRQLAVEVLQAVGEIAFFLVNKHRVSEAVNCSDKVPRYAVTVFDRTPKPSFDRFAFGFERAIFGRADRSALVGLAASIGPLNSTS